MINSGCLTPRGMHASRMIPDAPRFDLAVSSSQSSRQEANRALCEQDLLLDRLFKLPDEKRNARALVVCINKAVREMLNTARELEAVAMSTRAYYEAALVSIKKDLSSTEISDDLEYRRMRAHYEEELREERAARAQGEEAAALKLALSVNELMAEIASIKGDHVVDLAAVEAAALDEQTRLRGIIEATQQELAQTEALRGQAVLDGETAARQAAAELSKTKAKHAHTLQKLDGRRQEQLDGLSREKAESEAKRDALLQEESRKAHSFWKQIQQLSLSEKATHDKLLLTEQEKARQEAALRKELSQTERLKAEQEASMSAKIARMQKLQALALGVKEKPKDEVEAMQMEAMQRRNRGLMFDNLRKEGAGI